MLILSLHTKADGLQNQNHMLVVFITYSPERERERDHRVKEDIEMPARFHSGVVPHKSICLKRRLTHKKTKNKKRNDWMHKNFNFQL